jgi:glycosyltransferase involved in cell wall biosynthesis
VLIASHGYPPHGRFGTEFYTRELARGLAARGHEVEVFHPDRGLAAPAYSVAEETAEGVRVARVALSPGSKRSFAASYRDAELERVFDARLARRAPEVVHFTYLLGGLSLALPGIARRRGIPSVVTLTDYGLLCHRGQMFDARLARCFGPHPPEVCARCVRTASRFDARPLARRARNAAAEILARLGGLAGVPTTADLARRADSTRALFAEVELFLAPTRHLAEVFARAGVDARKLRTLVYAFDEAPYAAARRPPALPPRFGFAGQFAPHKGLATLVEAARRLDAAAPERPWKVSLWGASAGGRHARYAPEVLARADSRRVEVRPPFDAAGAPEALADLAALVVPSEWDENAPLSVLQARSLGVPVLASDVPGIAEVLSPRAGALVPPGDAGALAARMLDVLDGRIGRDPEPGLPLGFPEHLREIERLYVGLRRGADAAVDSLGRPT